MAPLGASPPAVVPIIEYSAQMVSAVPQRRDAQPQAISSLIKIDYKTCQIHDSINTRLFSVLHVQIISQSCVAKTLRDFIKILAIAALSLCLPVMAQEQNGWQFDSLPANSSVSKPDAQQVYEVLLKMLDRWNAHDIEGYLEVYWKSPELLVVVDSEQFNGWQQLHDSYINGYPDRNAMGFIQPKRIQVKLLKPDLALALTWWSVSFPSSKQKVVGNSTMNLQKFDDGWKIVASHTSIAVKCDWPPPSS